MLRMRSVVMRDGEAEEAGRGEWTPPAGGLSSGADRATNIGPGGVWTEDPFASEASAWPTIWGFAPTLSIAQGWTK